MLARFCRFLSVLFYLQPLMQPILPLTSESHVSMPTCLQAFYASVSRPSPPTFLFLVPYYLDPGQGVVLGRHLHGHHQRGRARLPHHPPHHPLHLRNAAPLCPPCRRYPEQTKPTRVHPVDEECAPARIWTAIFSECADTTTAMQIRAVAVVNETRGSTETIVVLSRSTPCWVHTGASVNSQELKCRHCLRRNKTICQARNMYSRIGKMVQEIEQHSPGW